MPELFAVGNFVVGIGIRASQILFSNDSSLHHQFADFSWSNIFRFFDRSDWLIGYRDQLPGHVRKVLANTGPGALFGLFSRFVQNFRCANACDWERFRRAVGGPRFSVCGDDAFDPLQNVRRDRRAG